MLDGFGLAILCRRPFAFHVVPWHAEFLTHEEVLLFAQGLGGEVSYLLRRIRLVIDQHPVIATVAWCQDEDINDMIVGRRDVFDVFYIEFRQSERRIIFTPVPAL